MASAPSDLGPVTGRVDRDGRLTVADPPLLRLQQEAGSRLGEPLALPQLASVARSAMKLGVPLSRPIIAASADQDLDLWVRVEPDADGAALTIDGWRVRAPAPPRLTLVGSEPRPDEEPSVGMGFQTDSELRFSRVDERAAEVLGLGAASLIGQPLTRHFLLADNADGVMPLLAALAGRHDFTGQRARVRGDKEIEVVLNGVALGSTKSGFAGYQVEVELEGQAMAPAGRVLDPALDEALRSPLDRIISAAERIVDRSEGPLRSDYAAYAGDIAAAGRHLLSVIQSMTAQESAALDGRVDLAQAASEAIQLVETRAGERSIQMHTVGTDHPLPANGDSRGVVQILVNLLGNAVRHSPEHATVTVIGERRSDKVAVTVVDEGPGIAEADHERIFERYERVGDMPGGIGLGLAISRRLARSMGGDILLQSTPGEGARFTLVLPAV